MTRACIYCGCTDDRPCVLEAAWFDASGRRIAGSARDCVLLSTDPPICSAPTCREKARREAADVEILLLDPSEVFVPPEVWDKVR